MGRHAKPNLFPDLSIRWNGPELMDDQTSDLADLNSTLASFKHVNSFLSGYTVVYNRYLLPDLLKNCDRQTTILDLGAGGCDIALWLHSRCEQLNLNVKILCIDADPRVVAFGKEVCAGYKRISIEHADFFDLDPASFGSDYILSNHVLHHIKTEHVPDLLHRIKQGARRGFIMNDICRSWLAYSLFTILAVIFLRKGFAFHDGRISIRRSFTLKEIHKLIKSAGFESSVQVKSLFPCRLLLLSSNW